VRHRGHYGPPAWGGQVGEDEINDSSPNIGEGVAVEEQERGAAMALPQEVYGLGEGRDFGLPASPLCFKRCMAL
jgi:hypothetical protein